MTARDLIEKLRDLPPDTRILIEGYEAGADEPSFDLLSAAPNPEPHGYNGTWIAEHDTFDRAVPEAGVERVVLLRRS